MYNVYFIGTPASMVGVKFEGVEIGADDIRVAAGVRVLARRADGLWYDYTPRDRHGDVAILWKVGGFAGDYERPDLPHVTLEPEGSGHRMIFERPGQWRWTEGLPYPHPRARIGTKEEARKAWKQLTPREDLPWRDKFITFRGKSVPVPESFHLFAHRIPRAPRHELGERIQAGERVRPLMSVEDYVDLAFSVTVPAPRNYGSAATLLVAAETEELLRSIVSSIRAEGRWWLYRHKIEKVPPLQPERVVVVDPAELPGEKLYGIDDPAGVVIPTR